MEPQTKYELYKRSDRTLLKIADNEEFIIYEAHRLIDAGELQYDDVRIDEVTRTTIHNGMIGR